MGTPRRTQAKVDKGRRLKAVRQALGMTQLQASERLGIELSTYQSMEQGYVDVATAKAALIAERFGLARDWLDPDIPAERNASAGRPLLSEPEWRLAVLDELRAIRQAIESRA